MTTALIGHTGFVGGTFLAEQPWGACYNSSNIADIAGQEFDLLVCAGVSAVKWQANKDPDTDRAGISRLTGPLATVRAREMVLVSTIDVYPHPNAGGTEDTAIDPATNHAYGRHRFELEQWCAARFPNLRIVRLPALFGTGLRKNAIYDLIHGHMVGDINPASAFQWYPLARLWSDIAVARQAGLDLVNLFPEPLPMRRIIDTLFPGAPVGQATHPAPRYDMQTRHGALFGGPGPYCMYEDAVFAALSAYVMGHQTP